MMRIAAVAMLILLLGGMETSSSQVPVDSRVADLVQSGVLRFGIGLGSPMLAVKDSTTAEIKGPAWELGYALARRLGVKFEAVEYPRPGAVIEGLRTSAWDISILAFDPQRAELVEFSNPFMQTDLTYLVRAGSTISSLADVDRPGTRIAVPRGDATDFYLTRTIKQAELIRTESHAAAVELLRTGGADVKASPRPALMGESKTLPGSRVLNESVEEYQFAAVVPKGQIARIAYVNDFIEEAKASGLVKRIIDALDLQGVSVAPPGKLRQGKKTD